MMVFNKYIADVDFSEIVGFPITLIVNRIEKISWCNTPLTFHYISVKQWDI